MFGYFYFKNIIISIYRAKKHIMIINVVHMTREKLNIQNISNCMVQFPEEHTLIKMFVNSLAFCQIWHKCEKIIFINTYVAIFKENWNFFILKLGVPFYLISFKML